jgi:hypothetical protein
MDKKNNKKELLSRRDFFKKAAISTLPFIAAVAVPSFLSSCSSEPTPSPSGCNGCSSTCEGSCNESCYGNSSNSSCSDCSSTCKGNCKDGCSNTCKNTAKSDANTGDKDNHTAVDLGLGALWATYNYGASSEVDFGKYVCWADPSGVKTTSNEVDYYSTSNPPRNISGTQYDVARMQWKNGWRIPTQQEAKELINKCSWKFETLKGVPGQRVTGPNGKSIFLPLAGYYYKEKANYIKEAGNYWTSTANTEPVYDSKGNKLPIRSAFNLNFGKNNGKGTANNSLLFDASRAVIRPVKDSNNGCKNCASGCSSGCANSCDNNCTAYCSSSCTASCGEDCTKGCTNYCIGQCQEVCTKACDNQCVWLCRGFSG